MTVVLVVVIVMMTTTMVMMMVKHAESFCGQQRIKLVAHSFQPSVSLWIELWGVNSLISAKC
jgi:hypothetical protein